MGVQDRQRCYNKDRNGQSRSLIWVLRTRILIKEDRIPPLAWSLGRIKLPSSGEKISTHTPSRQPVAMDTHIIKLQSPLIFLATFSVNFSNCFLHFFCFKCKITISFCGHQASQLTYQCVASLCDIRQQFHSALDNIC